MSLTALSTCPIYYKAIIFDCDGVMVDSEPLHCRTWREVFLSHGVEMDAADLDRFVGLDSAQTMAILMNDEKFSLCHDPQQWILEKRHLFWKYVDEILCEIRGVGGLLSTLSNRGVPLAMATGGQRGSWSRVLRRMGWEDIFNVIVGVDDVARSKPHPDIYNLTLERLGLSAHECLVFEDSIPGMTAARAAGLDVVGVASTHGEELLRQHGARAVVADFSDEAQLCSILSKAPTDEDSCR